MDFPLYLDLASKRVVYANDWGVGVRQFSLDKGETYNVEPSFVSGYSGISPQVSGFTWITYQPNKKATPLFSASGASGSFVVLAASPVLDYAIGGRDELVTETDISFYSAGVAYNLSTVPTIIANRTGLSPQQEYYPLYTNPSQFATSGDVSGASGVLQAQITAFQTGDGYYYPASNPSGFITGVDLTSYATKTALGATGNALEVQFLALQGQTGTYYPNSNPSGYITGDLSLYVQKSQTGQFYASSNPSGFITGVNLAPYATTGGLNATGQALQTEISALQAATGTYQPLSGILSFNYPLTNGTSSAYIPFSPPFHGTPIVAYALDIPVSGSLFALGTSGVNPSGFGVYFSGPLDASGYSLSVIARGS